MYESHFFLKLLTESENALNESEQSDLSADQISGAAQEWLSNVLDNVKECVDFLQEYKERICEIIDKNDIQESPFRRVQFLQEQVDNVLGFGKELYTQADHLLRMNNGIDTAIYLLKNDGKYPLLF